MSLKDHTQAGWRRYFSSSSTGTLISRRKSRTRHLALEFLESRQLLSTTVTEYPTPASVPPQPTDVVSLDGKLWFTVFGNAIGMLDPATSPPTIKSYSQGLPAGSGPQSITVGPDGNLWFTELLGGAIGTLDPASSSPIIQNYGTTQGMPANARPFGITTGPDGQGQQVIWFTDLSNNALGEINPSSPGSITEIPVTTNQHPLIGFSQFDSVITAGPDGKLYFTESGTTGTGIGIYDPSATPSQAWTEVKLPSSNQVPLGLTVGPDGNIWFSEGVPNSSGGYQSSGLGILNLSSSPPTLSEPAGLSVSGSSAPYQIATGPDGNIWFTLPSAGEVGVVQVESNPANDTISTFAVPPSTQVPTPVPSGITAGPDGSVWFADASGAVGRVSLDTNLAIAVQPPQPPASVTTGVPFGVTVAVLYSDTGAVDKAYSGNVTLALANNPGGSTLSGPTTMAASGGVAVFSGLSLNNPGVNYILQATAIGVTPVTTASFTVQAPPAPPAPLAPQIVSASVVTTQKTKKGKPVLTGYQFTFNTAMNSSITNLNDYQVQIYVPGKGRGKNKKPPHYQAIGFSLKPMSSTTVQVLTGTQTSTTFKNGGRITLIGTGISSAAGAFLGGDPVYSIYPGGRRIT